MARPPPIWATLKTGATCLRSSGRPPLRLAAGLLTVRLLARVLEIWEPLTFPRTSPVCYLIVCPEVIFADKAKCATTRRLVTWPALMVRTLEAASASLPSRAATMSTLRRLRATCLRFRESPVEDFQYPKDGDASGFSFFSFLLPEVMEIQGLWRFDLA